MAQHVDCVLSFSVGKTVRGLADGRRLPVSPVLLPRRIVAGRRLYCEEGSTVI